MEVRASTQSVDDNKQGCTNGTREGAGHHFMCLLNASLSASKVMSVMIECGAMRTMYVDSPCMHATQERARREWCRASSRRRPRTTDNHASPCRTPGGPPWRRSAPRSPRSPCTASCRQAAASASGGASSPARGGRWQRQAVIKPSDYCRRAAVLRCACACHACARTMSKGSDVTDAVTPEMTDETTRVRPDFSPPRYGPRDCKRVQAQARTNTLRADGGGRRQRHRHAAARCCSNT